MHAWRLQTCCGSRVTVHSTSHVEVLDASGVGAGANGTAPAAAPGGAAQPGRKPPLLSMDLMPNKDATRFVYSTQPDLIVSKVMALFDAAISECLQLSQLCTMLLQCH